MSAVTQSDLFVPPGANHESSEVVEILLPMTFYFNPATRLDNVRNFWRFVISPPPRGPTRTFNFLQQPNISLPFLLSGDCRLGSSASRPKSVEIIWQGRGAGRVGMLPFVGRWRAVHWTTNTLTGISLDRTESGHYGGAKRRRWTALNGLGTVAGQSDFHSIIRFIKNL